METTADLSAAQVETLPTATKPSMGPPQTDDTEAEPPTECIQQLLPTATKPSMGPPQADDTKAEPPAESIQQQLLPTVTKPSMGPPQTDDSETEPPTESILQQLPPPLPSNGGSKEKQPQSGGGVGPPYVIPPWSQPPSFPFFFEVLKDGSIIDQLDVTKKGAYMFGRIDACDFVLEHPTISRFHAVLQFKGDEGVYLYDLGSTHGTFINKNQIKKKVHVDLHVGDVIRFGLSTRLYIFQGPSDLMPPERDLSSATYAKDREASLRRARENAALADGISWGMQEDAIEEAEDDPDEITWQNYKGELTEKQQKTREKVLKRMEKIAHMKKEISAIRAKDIAQGGLTQGQQTQIARNEMRISQLMEELESLEETLNDSIRESIGARAGKSSFGRQKGAAEDEDELLSDDDEFYDRTTKKPVKKAADKQKVETADSLLDKKEALVKDMEEKRRLLLEERKNMSKSEAGQDAGDALDAFMSGLSSQLVLDKTVQLEKDLSSLQTELDRVVYLLKVADPTGEAAKKRQTAQACEPLPSHSSVKKVVNPKVKLTEARSIAKPSSASSNTKQPTSEVNAKQSTSEVNAKQSTSDVTKEGVEAPKPSVDASSTPESKPTVYQAAKPQWLGAVDNREREESQQELQTDNDDDAEFVGYQDRKKILDSNSTQKGVSDSDDLENAAPGLILRKKKQVEKADLNDDKLSSTSTSGAAMMAEDAVALLLKHKRGLYVSEEDASVESHDGRDQKEGGQDNKRPRRVLGPEKPAFLEKNPEYETWVPPEGQSGDGRTSLNDRLGY